MLDISKLKNRTVLLRLKEYEGPNEYIQRLKRDALKGKVVLTTTQIEYISNYHDIEPMPINRVVGITTYLGEQLKEKWSLNHVPERILVEELLAESDKWYHIKGKLFKNQKKSELYFLPKTQFLSNIFEDEGVLVTVDYSKYEEMDKLGRTPFKHQKEGIEFLLSKNKGILADDMGLGKAIPNDTPVLTPKGWVPHGSLKVGDFVIGSDGKPTKVLKTYPNPLKKYYKVTFTDNLTVECCDEHLWYLQSHQSRKKGLGFEVKVLKDLIGDTRWGARYNIKWFLPIVKPVEFEPREVNYEPYELGRIVATGILPQERGSLKKLEVYNLTDTKHVPHDFKYNTVDVRLSVLQGILDTAGHPDTLGIKYYNSNELLVDDVIELVNSLGGIAKKDFEEGTFSLVINLPEEFTPFRLQRKLNKFKGITPVKIQRGIKYIKFSRETYGQCISVENEDRLYVIDKYAVTHNTYQSIVAALETGVQKVLVVCPANAKINWQREICNFVPEDEVSIIRGRNWVSNGKFTIINYDILKNFHTLVDSRKKYNEGEIHTELIDENFDLVILDECFTYNTKVKTETGELSIGDIVENNLDVKILSYNLNNKTLEYKKINRWIQKSTKNTLLKIKLSNDVFIECTPNHKIYVKNKGYVRADEIIEGNELYYLSEGIIKKTTIQQNNPLFERMCEQRYCGEKQNKRKIQKTSRGEFEGCELSDLWCRISNKKKSKTKVLFNKLFSEMENVTKRYSGEDEECFNERAEVRDIKRNAQKTPTYSETIFGEDEEKQPNEKSDNTRKNEGKTKRSNLFKSWWERKNNKTTRCNPQIVRWGRNGLDFRIPNKNKRSKRRLSIITQLLFTGYRKSGIKVSHRNRWKLTQIKKMEIPRQKKNGSLKCFRVESIEVLERGSRHEQGTSSNYDTKVYNLEVADNHNYFANGVLVSNCHMVKNSDAARTKILNQVVKNINRRWLLSGTPIANRPMDYFNLLYLCDSPLTANWQYYAFRYCDAKKFTKRLKSGKLKQIWLTNGASNLEELHNRSKQNILRRVKEDHLDLPPKIVSPYYLELENMKGYKTVFDEYLTWAESVGKHFNSGRHMIELIVLRKFIAMEKVSHSVELAQQAIDEGKKVIIFTNFTDSFNSLMSQFGNIAVGHNGKMNEKQKQNSVDQFQNNDKVKVFVGNLVSAGTAITLTKASVVIMNDLDYVPANHAQAEDRSWRIGVQHTVNVYYPIFEGTIDVTMYDILRQKMKIISKVIGEDYEDVDISTDLIKSIGKFKNGG